MEVDPTGVVAPTDGPGAPIAADQPPTAKPAAKPAQDEPQTLRDAFGRQIVKIKDRQGVEHVLGQIDLFDLMDLEDDLGPVASWSNSAFSIRSCVSVFWLAFRREGMTDEQADAARHTGKWAHVRNDINRLFGAEHMMSIINVAGDLLTNLGLMVRPNRPTKAAEGSEASPAAAPTGGN